MIPGELLDLDTRSGWQQLLRALGIRPSRALGQNFLVEPAVVQRIAETAEIQPEDHVVEIGPGMGILTRELEGRGVDLTAVELDRDLAAYLRDRYRGHEHVRIIESDFLKMPLEDLVPAGEPWIVVANLPYAVANPIIRRLLEADHPPRRLCVMVQREVAERMTAKPPDMSILTVAIQLFAEARIAFDVKPGSFVPPPAIDSSVVLLDLRDQVPVPPEQRAWFFTLVNAGFRHKRKTAANSLADILRLPKSETAGHLAAIGLDPMLRAERLSVDDWARLAASWPEPAS